MRHSQCVLRRYGEFWTVAFGGCVWRMRHAIGLNHLAYLLARPREEILSLLLSAAAYGSSPPDGLPELHRLPGDAGPLLDGRAVAQYAERLRELRAELAETEAHHDLGRAEMLRATIDAIERELARGVGLNGVRRASCPLERARVRVTKAIWQTAGKIGRLNPPLGTHLRATIRTGTSCVYLPDPRVPIRWIV
jgi:hypothetical protein